MSRLTMRCIKPLLCMLVLGTACTVSSRAAAPATSKVESEPDQAALALRVQRATELRESIATSVAYEDAPRKGKTKTLLVADQVRETSALAAQSVPTTPYREPDVRSYEEACARLLDSYLGSLLESTDPSASPGPWAIDDGRDVLGSASVDQKLALWQAQNPERPFAKFAVVRAADGTLSMRVGRLDVGHVDIAGGPALSAGLLRTAVHDGKTEVVVLENTSGGYRPGPLRNRLSRAALEAARYMPSASELTVHDNPSGSYDHSKLIPAKR
jgi:hypothetical protein